MHFKILSAICLNLDQSKILSPVNGFKRIVYKLLDYVDPRSDSETAFLYSFILIYTVSKIGIICSIRSNLRIPLFLFTFKKIYSQYFSLSS